MKLSITYAELQDYVARHYHKKVELGYVNGSTVSVSVPVKVLGFTKFININLIVKKIEGSDLFLSYEGKMGIEMLVTPVVSFAKKLVPEKSDWIKECRFLHPIQKALNCRYFSLKTSFWLSLTDKNANNYL